MSKFTLNDVPVGIDNEEETEMEQEVKEVKEEFVTPKVIFENEETYKIAITSMREGLIRLVQEGFLLESVAERLMTDFMFSTFNQLVKLRLE